MLVKVYPACNEFLIPYVMVLNNLTSVKEVIISILQLHCNALASFPGTHSKNPIFEQALGNEAMLMLKCILVSNSFNAQYSVCSFLFTSQASLLPGGEVQNNI